MNKNVFTLPAIIVALAIAYYFIFYLPQANNIVQALENQQKCANKAEQFFKERKYPDTTDSYTDHWNKNLGKCFVLVRSMTLSGGEIDRIQNLVDVFENKSYGSIVVTRSGQGPMSRPVSTFCSLLKGGTSGGNSDCSEVEFNTYVADYMKE